MCVILPNFALIGQTVPEIWPIFDSSRWRPPPSWISENSNFNGSDAQLVRTASTCQILSRWGVREGKCPRECPTLHVDIGYKRHSFTRFRVFDVCQCASPFMG